MPLSRNRDQILVTMNGVKFLMQDGDTEVPCRVTRELLAERFDSKGDQDDEAAFRRHRAVIEQAASAKYDAGETEDRIGPKVIVTAYDLASPLSRKL